MRLRSIKVISQPTVEPVSLREAKAHLRLLPDQNDDDQYIVGLIATGRRLIERRLTVSLVATQLRATFDNEEPAVDWRLAASFMPTLNIMSTQYRAALGIVEPFVRLPVSPLLLDSDHPVALSVDGVTVDPATYRIDDDSVPPLIRFDTVPTVPAKSTLVVTYWSGYGGATPCPPQLKSALLLYVGHLYTSREAVVSDGSQPAELPLAFDTLLASECVNGRW